VQYLPDKLVPYKTQESIEQYRARVMGYLGDYRYRVTESGINEIHRMTTKLFYIQLMKLGFPISWWTFAKIAQIPNFGPPPEGTNTEMERWIAQKEIEVDMAVNLQQRVAAMTGGMIGAGGGSPEQPGASGLPGPTGQAGAGRPQSFQRPPRLESKDQGTRSTITTS